MHTAQDITLEPSDLLYDPMLDAWLAVTNHYIIVAKNHNDNYFLIETWAITNETGNPDMLFSIRKDSDTPYGSLTLINIIASFDNFTEEFN
tara:strand:+ start:27 stop:299 length:273 start_codon:yes stop_codon:yes gene_type:complete